MMAYHSELNNLEIGKKVCGFYVIPFRKFPLERSDGEEEDIVDEAIKFYRINILFKNYEINGPADLLLVYLTVFINHCLRVVEKEETYENAKKKLLTIAKESVPEPDDKNFFMNSIFEPTKDPKEKEQYQTYLKGLKEETVMRLLMMLYDKEGRTASFKFWVGMSKRKFLGLSFDPKF